MSSSLLILFSIYFSSFCCYLYTFYFFYFPIPVFQSCFYFNILSNFQFFRSSFCVFLSSQLLSSYSALTLFPVVFSQFSKYFSSFCFESFCSSFHPFLSSQLPSSHSLLTCFQECSYNFKYIFRLSVSNFPRFAAFILLFQSFFYYSLQFYFSFYLFLTSKLVSSYSVGIAFPVVFS